MTIDRTQWKDDNVLLVAVIWKKRALPVYWQILNKRGASNLREQQAVIRPVLRLLKNYELVFIGDREFHSVELSYWLKGYSKRTNKVYFAFRQKQNSHLKTRRGSHQKLRELKLRPGLNCAAET